MCDPITIASLVATAAGTAMQMQSQRQTQKDMSRAMARNNEKNKLLEQQNSEAAAKARKGYDRESFDQNMNADIADLAQKYQAAQSDGTVPGEFKYRNNSSTPEIVKNLETQKRGEAKNFTNNYAQALANMSGFGNTMFSKGLDTRRGAEVTSMNNQFERGNNSVLESQLASIQSNAGSPIGDLLTAAGSLGMMAGLKGAPMPTDITAPGNMGIKPPTTIAAGSRGLPTGLQFPKAPIPGMPTFGGLY